MNSNTDTDVKITLPTTTSHVVAGSDLYEIEAFPWTNLTKISPDHLELETDYYCANPKIRPQRKINLDLHGHAEFISYPAGNPEQLKTWDERVIPEMNCRTPLVRHLQYSHISIFLRRDHCFLLENFSAEQKVLDMHGKEIGLSKRGCLEYSNLDEFEVLKGFKVHSISIIRWNYYILIVLNSTTYILSDITNKILKVLHAPECDLQEGDSGTVYYLLDNKHLVIHNQGDVYSTIVIRNRDASRMHEPGDYLAKNNCFDEMMQITYDYFTEIFGDYPDGFDIKHFVKAACRPFQDTLKLLKNDVLPLQDFYEHYEFLKVFAKKIQAHSTAHQTDNNQRDNNKRYYNRLRVEVLGLPAL